MANPEWVAGKSGNPNGIPKKDTAHTDILKTLLDKPSSDNPDAPKIKEAVMQKLVNLALEGDMVALKYLTDRIDGTPTQVIEQDLNAEIGVINVGLPKFLKEDK